MNRKAFALTWAALLVAACAPAPTPKPPIEQSDAARAPSCASACERMKTLGCELGKPTPRGMSCETVCDNVQVENAGAGFPVACLSAAASCAAAGACR